MPSDEDSAKIEEDDAKSYEKVNPERSAMAYQYASQYRIHYARHLEPCMAAAQYLIAADDAAKEAEQWKLPKNMTWEVQAALVRADEYTNSAAKLFEKCGDERWAHDPLSEWVVPYEKAIRAYRGMKNPNAASIDPDVEIERLSKKGKECAAVVLEGD
jgi:hypothetical protein